MFIFGFLFCCRKFVLFGGVVLVMRSRSVLLFRALEKSMSHNEKPRMASPFGVCSCCFLKAAMTASSLAISQ
ncbi:MAG: hypothetical protein CNE99_10300 [OM182 bacterium MED-G24]|uniref:Uncharacterized protein n=1 Tax=OM182 bacterium MED-G24 TaxID=1986255 RepID=A0A2A5WHQ3_9GAMM|nr:MAG: hypothetical protein CNE99_10300 [OM182 bacterium MED-G24]